MIEQLPRNTAFVKITAVYGQIIEKAGLSVKCVLLTDKSAKNGALSVKFE